MRRDADSFPLMTVSLVTVCRNSASTIRKTIESVLSQKEADLEYIIIDGGSSDGTQDIVRSFGDGIDIFVSEPDKGIADAFNKGIARASGSVIGLLNADDVLLAGALDHVRAWFGDNSGSAILHGDVFLYDGDLFIKRLKPAGRWWYPWRLVLFNHPATFVRREIYAELGVFDREYSVAMDVEIFARWTKGGASIHYSPKPLVRMQAGGVSSRRALYGYAEARRALVSHGFPSIVANAQYIFRFGVQLVVAVQAALRRIK